jgi:membrane-associated phospholipid phosphatase
MTATSSRSGSVERRTLRLERSPFEPAVLLRLAAAAAVLLVVATLLGFLVAGDPPPRFDARIAEATTAPTDTTLNAVAYVLGRVGHLWIVAVLALVLAVVARLRSGRWDLALLLATVLGGATVMTGLVKLVTDRARPDGATVSTLSAAFPSGHSVRAAAVFGLTAWVLRAWSRRATVQRLVIPAAVVLVLLNAAARVVLGVHWPTDVIAGITLGTVWLVLCLRFLRPAAVPAAGPPG